MRMVLALSGSDRRPERRLGPTPTRVLTEGHVGPILHTERRETPTSVDESAGARDPDPRTTLDGTARDLCPLQESGVISNELPNSCAIFAPSNRDTRPPERPRSLSFQRTCRGRCET